MKGEGRMYIKQIMPAPGWRVFEAFGEDPFHGPNHAPGEGKNNGIAEQVPIIGWGIISDDDEDKAHGCVEVEGKGKVELLVYDNEDKTVKPLSEWRIIEKSAGTGNHSAGVPWNYVVVPPHRSDKEACEELLGR